MTLGVGVVGVGTILVGSRWAAAADEPSWQIVFKNRTRETLVGTLPLAVGVGYYGGAMVLEGKHGCKGTYEAFRVFGPRPTRRVQAHCRFYSSVGVGAAFAAVGLVGFEAALATRALERNGVGASRLPTWIGVGLLAGGLGAFLALPDDLSPVAKGVGFGLLGGAGASFGAQLAVNGLAFRRYGDRVEAGWTMAPTLGPAWGVAIERAW